MEHPNKLVNSFNGVIDLGKIGREPIQHQNLLLRGCALRNTEWIIGVVVNTGHDTKIMMSSASTRSKTSKLEAQASTEIQKIILLLAIVCFAGATGQAIWNKTNVVAHLWYLNWNPAPVGFWFQDFFYFFLLHATFIPVSLYVSMSVSRYFQSYFMNNDLEMYYDLTDTPALVRTMTLNEELGQISHIFSDKTGTLTCNIMDYRKSSINGVSYGLGITEIGKAAWKLQGIPIDPEVLASESKARINAVPHVCFYCPQYEHDMNHNDAQRVHIQQFYRLLAICHDVIPERIDGKVKLSASNPDDEALVCAADYFGFQFIDRRERSCIVLNKTTNVEEHIEELIVIKFSSKRKRMTVVVRESDGAIKVMCKGADTVITPRLHSGQDLMLSRTESDMRRFSIEGLRCLYIAIATVSEETFRSWNIKYQQAITDLNQIEKQKKELPNDIDTLEDVIESNLTLLGATAIEDRLQDGVPECIAELVKAGINIWVLTGDKEETAINIAVACNLVLPKEYMHHVIINSSNAADAGALLKTVTSEIKVGYKTCVIINYFGLISFICRTMKTKYLRLNNKEIQ
jgi:phospholipid-transporting ATPase